MEGIRALNGSFNCVNNRKTLIFLVYIKFALKMKIRQAVTLLSLVLSLLNCWENDMQRHLKYKKTK